MHDHRTGSGSAAAAMISLRYFQPAVDLRRYVSSYYLFESRLPQVADIVRADLPQIRFMLAGAGRYAFAGESAVATPEISLMGPTMAASRFTVDGPVRVFGVGLLPTGWAVGVSEDASRFVHRIDDAAARFGPMFGDALDAMRCAPAAEAMVSIADAVMRAALARRAEPPAAFTALVESWLTETGAPAVDTLIARSGLSARQLERLANRIFGAPPKLLARKYRALHAASQLCDPARDWASVAGDAFYDQSHFIREVKRFTGLTPTQFQADPPPVTRLMHQRRGFAAQMPRIAMVR